MDLLLFLLRIRKTEKSVSTAFQTDFWEKTTHAGCVSRRYIIHYAQFDTFRLTSDEEQGCAEVRGSREKERDYFCGGGLNDHHEPELASLLLPTVLMHLHTSLSGNVIWQWISQHPNKWSSSSGLIPVSSRAGCTFIPPCSRHEWALETHGAIAGPNYYWNNKSFLNLFCCTLLGA